MKRLLIILAAGRRLPLLCLAVACLAYLPAQAKPAIKELSDVQMDMVRGKYAGYGQILYFGVEMASQWQTRDGRLYQAGLDLSVDATTLRPTITLFNSTSATQAPTAASTGTNVHIDGSGLQNIAGESQGIQIGGDGNRVQNDMVMDIGSSAASHAATGTLATTSGHYILPSPGATTTFDVAPGSLTLALNVAGQGQLTQALRSGFGLQQFVQVTGDQNQIHNSLRITATMPGGLSQPGRLSQSVLDTLKGLQGGH